MRAQSQLIAIFKKTTLMKKMDSDQQASKGNGTLFFIYFFNDLADCELATTEQGDRENNRPKVPSSALSGWLFGRRLRFLF
jgi:hypothetical protein